MLARLFANELRAWHGEARLADVFWRGGVLTSCALALLYAGTLYRGWILAEQILVIVVALYSLWILVSIWRCSVARDDALATLARFLTIAWAVNVALVLLFRQLDLLGYYLGLPGPGPQ